MAVDFFLAVFENHFKRDFCIAPYLYIDCSIENMRLVNIFWLYFAMVAECRFMHVSYVRLPYFVTLLKNR